MLSENPAMTIGAAPWRTKYVVTVKLIFEPETFKAWEIVLSAGK